MRRCSSLLIALAAVGCAFDDGQPWGEARIAIEAAFEVSADRLEGDAIRTNNDYRVRVIAAELSTDAVVVRFAASGGAQAFDPADPPPEYSLCHNGHCHHEDGRLVDYEDITIELAGGGPSIAAPVLEPIALVPNGAPEQLALGQCGDARCDLPRGEFSSVEVQIRAARFEVEVADRRTGDAARLDAPRTVTVTVDTPFFVQSPLSGVVGRGAPVGRDIEGQLILDATAFDNLDWQTDPPGSALRDALLESLELRIR